MTKSKKHRGWLVITVLVLAFLVFLFPPLNQSANAMLSDAHIGAVLLRFRNEIIQKSPAGRYYEALAWKHSEELNQILTDHQEHADKETIEIIRMFIPGLEALLDGKGDTVRITKDQINSLNTELDWIYSYASPSLREDLEKEEQRYPLNNFIGMTMSEALNYVNSNWKPDTSTESVVASAPSRIFDTWAEPTVTATETARTKPVTVATETPQLTPTLYCVVGYDPDCLKKPKFATGPDGLWAAYVLHEVYFEYPSTWRMEQSITKPDILYLIPAPDSPGGSPAPAMYFFVTILPDQPNIPYDPLTYPQTALQRPTSIWNRLISLTDFEGSEFLWQSYDKSYIYLEAIFYEPTAQITLGLLMPVQKKQIDNAIYDSDLVQEHYPIFGHIMESIRIWKP